MQTECTPSLFEFEPVNHKKVVAGFDGGTITSDAGGLLLGQLDRGLGLIRRMAACFTDRRDPRLLEHRVETLVGQRVFGLAPNERLIGLNRRDHGCPGGSTGTSHAASLRVTQSATRSSAGPSYGLPGQPATPRATSHQVMHFYSGQWCTFTPALTQSHAAS